jgi:hypothetical protein
VRGCPNSMRGRSGAWLPIPMRGRPKRCRESPEPRCPGAQLAAALAMSPAAETPSRLPRRQPKAAPCATQPPLQQTPGMPPQTLPRQTPAQAPNPIANPAAGFAAWQSRCGAAPAAASPSTTWCAQTLSPKPYSPDSMPQTLCPKPFKSSCAESAACIGVIRGIREGIWRYCVSLFRRAVRMLH